MKFYPFELSLCNCQRVAILGIMSENNCHGENDFDLKTINFKLRLIILEALLSRISMVSFAATRAYFCFN